MGRCISDAIVVFHIVLTIWQGHSLYYLLPFISRLRISFLEFNVRTARFLFPAYICHLHCTLDRYLYMRIHVCYDEFSQCTREQLSISLVIKLLSFIIMDI